MTLSIILLVVMQNIALFHCYAGCHYAECLYVECLNSNEFLYAECLRAECRGALI